MFVFGAAPGTNRENLKISENIKEKHTAAALRPDPSWLSARSLASGAALTFSFFGKKIRPLWGRGKGFGQIVVRSVAILIVSRRYRHASRRRRRQTGLIRPY